MAAIGKILGITVLALAGGAAAAYLAGVRVELDGTGSRPMLTYGTRESRYDELERSRAAQQTEAPAAEAPPAAPTAGAKPEP
ncbi:MAG: hypothetical protein J0L64_10815, partial [Acidobacteria bacterium]|nr:hypothetical protein [Acidobacteriota bacterium]